MINKNDASELIRLKKLVRPINKKIRALEKKMKANFKKEFRDKRNSELKVFQIVLRKKVLESDCSNVLSQDVSTNITV